MKWPDETEREWQLIIAELEESAHGFFLLRYDRSFTYEAVIRRLTAEFKSRHWYHIQVTLADRFVDFIESKLEGGSINAVVVNVDQNTAAEKLRALNLIREKLFRLPTNFIFLVQDSMFAELSLAARDFVTWTKLPYTISLPENDLPDVLTPVLTATTTPDLSDRIEYYREQIQQALDDNHRDKAYQLLPALAELYLEAELFEAACELYQALMSYYRVGASDIEHHRYREKFELAEGWRILAALNAGRVDPSEQQKLKSLFDKSQFYVTQTKDGLAIIDSAGRSNHFSVELFVRLSLLSEKFQQDFRQVAGQTADPRLLLLDAEKSYTYSATRYGLGYNCLQVKLSIGEDGSAEVYRRVDVEAYSAIDSLDTFLLKNEEGEAASQIRLKEAKSLSPDRVIRVIDKRDELNRLASVMTISPQLSYGDRVTYEMTEETTAGLFAVNQEELKKREVPNDHFGWTINRPTRKLILEVVFPQDCTWDKHEAEVRYAGVGGLPSLNLQRAERERLQEPELKVANARPLLRLEVEYPMTGLLYILRWQ